MSEAEKSIQQSAQKPNIDKRLIERRGRVTLTSLAQLTFDPNFQLYLQQLNGTPIINTPIDQVVSKIVSEEEK